MRKFYLLLILTSICFRCAAQHEPVDFFKDLFNSLKNADSAGFTNSFLSDTQFGLLAEAQLKTKTINQDSLDNAPINGPDFRLRLATALSQRLLKKLDSLHLDRTSMHFLDYRYEQVRDTGVLCTSLKGAVYFKSRDNYYQWNIGEAILVKGIWKLIDPGVIDSLKHYEFLTSSPRQFTVFNSLKAEMKVKIVSVVLQPPPPITKQIPPAPPRKKKNNN